MHPMIRNGLLVSALHVTIVGSLGATLLVDRSIRPRVWVRAFPVDPEAPIRGRYVSLGIEVAVVQRADPRSFPVVADRPGLTVPPSVPVRLAVQDDRLVAIPSDGTNGLRVRAVQRAGGQVTVLDPPIAYFIPEHAADPSRHPPGEELWAEVTIPRSGAPRPIRLGLKKNGVLTPLNLD